MNTLVIVDGFGLTVPAGWWIWKYDDSAFHRNQFQNFAGGSKAVDAVAFAPDGTLWLIELKDYRRNRRSKAIGLGAEVADKLKSSLAGLATAHIRANDATERRMAKLAIRCKQIRVALQVAQPMKPSRLFPQVIDAQEAQIKLRQAVHVVDAHPICVVGDVGCNRVPWVTSIVPGV